MGNIIVNYKVLKKKNHSRKSLSESMYEGMKVILYFEEKFFNLNLILQFVRVQRSTRKHFTKFNRNT